MADNYSVQVVTSLLASSTTERTTTQTAAANLTENFWADLRLPAGASDQALVLNLLTDPTVIVLEGDEGIWMSFSIGGDKIYADPIAVVSDEGNGLGYGTIYLGNDDAVEHSIKVIAVE
jgi:hypothetical protein